MEKITVSSFTKDRKAIAGHIGLELEVEGKHKEPPEIDNYWWKSIKEQSLRNGREYITKKPLQFNNNFFNKLAMVTSEVDQPKNKIDKKSHRTSVHVHVNVTNHEPVEVWTAITGYWLLENLLFKFFNKDREGNLFCQRLKDAEGILSQVNTDLEDNKPFVNFHIDMAKYGAINLASVYNKGSLEYRGMHGSIDPEEIYGWCDTLYSITNKLPLVYKSPDKLMDDLFLKGWKKVFSKLLSEDVLSTMKKILNNDDLVDENAFRITSYVYGTNWDAYSKRLKKPAQKKKPKEIPNAGPQAIRWHDIALPEFD